jgi:hypothetical protein
MIGTPALIGRAANNPVPLIGDLRFCHSCFRLWDTSNELLVKIVEVYPILIGIGTARSTLRRFNDAL